MRILILSNSGMGLYKFRKELIQQLIVDGNNVYLSLPADEFTSQLIDLGCHIIETKMERRGKNPINDFKLLLNYRKIIKKVEPEVVLTYTIKPNIYGGIACRSKKVPYISTVTGLGTAIENKGFLSKITLFLYKIGVRKSRCVFFQNKSNLDLFKNNKIVKTNYQVVSGSGVNLNEYVLNDYPKEYENLQITYIGRIMKNKGINELLEASEELNKVNKSIKIHIVGFCEEEYEERLVQLHDNNVIEYHGSQKDVRKYIKESHAIILPSYHEGLSNVLLEASSMGRPILATDIPGCNDIIKDRFNGILFKPYDYQEVVNAINIFSQMSYDDKKTLGLNARKVVEENFNRENVIQKYIKIIYEKEM